MAGICKVIPPHGWFHREYDLNEELGDLVVTSPIQQAASGSNAVYDVTLFTTNDMSVRDFYQYCQKDPSVYASTVWKEREKRFWRTIGPITGHDPPLYG